MRELLIFVIVVAGATFGVYRSCWFEFFCPAERIPGTPLEEVLREAEDAADKVVSKDSAPEKEKDRENEKSSSAEKSDSETVEENKETETKNAEDKVDSTSQVVESAAEKSCKPYLTANIRPGRNNDKEQVKKLEKFLNEYEGEKLVVGGIYDAADVAAVKRFQEKYADEILKPFGLNSPTGLVLSSTRKKINDLYCQKTSRSRD